MKKLKDKNCLLTGGATGIGRCLAIGLAKEGMNLFIADIDVEGLEKVKKEIEGFGVKVFTGRVDISRYEDFENLAKQVYSELGDIDLLINNAGIAGGGLVEALELEEWKHVLDINLWGIIHSLKVFLPRMVERGSGHIVNTGSGAGVVGIPYHIHYIASKFAVAGISEALYSELSHKGIKVSVICPTYLKTNIIDRTPIKVVEKFIESEDPEDVKKKAAEFKRLFWEKYMANSMSVEQAARRYIKGIKKDRLYIFDSRRPRIGMFLKAVFERLYKKVLRSECNKDIKMIEEVLSELGIKYDNI